jgi:hypothetical protein
MAFFNLWKENTILHVFQIQLSRLKQSILNTEETSYLLEFWPQLPLTKVSDAQGLALDLSATEGQVPRRMR